MEAASNEMELVRLFKGGDGRAFEAIMRHYEPYVLGLLWRMTGDRSKAEDLCQETFLKMLRGLQQFKGDCALKTWIFRVAHNVAADYFRGSKHEPEQLEEKGEAVLGTAKQASDPHGEVERDQVREAIEQAMGQLSGEQREVLHLFYWGDLSVSEIAAALSVPEGTVKTHLFRGRQALRQKAAGLLGG